MASATSNSSKTSAAVILDGVKRRLTDAGKPRAKGSKKAPETRLPFMPGSLNDQLSKLTVGESLARCKRFCLSGEFPRVMNEQSQKYYKNQNSILSGGIAKVRAHSEHKHKKFSQERGSYTGAGNDAMFFFVVVTRTE